MTVKVFAPAKINLTLHVTGQRDDGFHLIDSLVVFADVGDTLTLDLADDSNLLVIGPEADGVPLGDENSVIQAARLMNGKVSIVLEKALPTAAGIGGGTADAAACLRAISELTGCPLPTDLLSLGADAPVCVTGKAARMLGIGEQITPLADLPPLYAVLVNPRVPVSTADVFSSLCEKTNPPMPPDIPVFSSAGEFAIWLSNQRNDLEIPAIGLQPVIRGVLTRLSGISGCMLARMSGSGATCFALFDTYGYAEVCAKNLRQEYPNWWVADCALS